MIKRTYSEIISYLHSLSPFILISFFVFFLAVIGGYFFAEKYTLEAQNIISFLKETYGPILEMSKPAQFLFIFLKNGITSFIVIFSGVLFGIIPLLALISNGEVLGILTNFILKDFSISYFLTGILPHGILEIPAFLISGALGLKIAQISVKKVLRKEKGNLVRELNWASKVFLKVVLPLLLIASLIEVFFTSKLI